MPHEGTGTRIMLQLAFDINAPYRAI